MGASDRLRSLLSTPRGRRTLATTGAATTLSAGLGAVATTPDDPWYAALDKPSWDPPGWVYPAVWTPLYADLAVTSAAALTALGEQGRREEASMLRRTLAVNLVLNTGWSVLFWRSRRPWLSTVWCAALAAHSGVLVRRVGEVEPALAAALAPYPAWCSFATVLNGTLARRNA